MIIVQFILCDQGNSITDQDGQIFSNHLDHYTIIVKLTIFSCMITGKFILGDQGNSITDHDGHIFSDHLDHYTIIVKLTIFSLPDHWTIHTR